MPSYRTGRVSEILAEREGLQRILVEFAPSFPGASTSRERAYVLTRLTGEVSVGDRVVVNTTAVELGLGTGGWHVVHWNLERDSWSEPGPGHIMKLRYTSLQADTGAAEEHSDELDENLSETPVLVCGLHSQVATVTALSAHSRPESTIAYVMTDGAALPLAMSDLVYELRRRKFLAGTITCGHAFGGDLEAVSAWSALALARHRLGASLIVVGMGPGIVGTGTRLGTTGLEVAGLIDAVAGLGGTPIAVVRASSGDPRERHRGVSHHTLTALDLARSRAIVPVPPELDPSSCGEWPEAVVRRHQFVVVDPPDPETTLDALDLRVTTMGRGPGEDRLFFRCAAAAASVAVGML
ncbi:MAG: hypothetical protein KatS3mg008_0262 [Acidimicrobiales bacterium]|nr:MAG: hypothetical protein KatS3mg008_0262 [Acidimicrobiales bacterium]